MYPAYYTNCIAVAATDGNDARASWSNYGDWVDVAAPGVSIYSTLRDNDYGYKSGTSMASPHVAGLAALVFTMVGDSNGNGFLNDEVCSQIQATCDDIGVSGIGSGRINAYRAVQTGTATGASVGIVTNSGDRMPVAGASVSDGVRTAVTDASGRYVISGVPAGTYTLTASAAGYSTSSQVVSVVAEQATTADFALPKLPALWAESITFGVTGKNLCLTAKVVSQSGAVAGAQVAVQLTNGVQNWSLTGTTDSSGTASFVVTRAPTSSYGAYITAITAAGYTWDTTQGVTSASYTIKRGGGKR
jgi:thermitase